MAGVATCVALAAAEKLTSDRAGGVGAEGDATTSYQSSAREGAVR